MLPEDTSPPIPMTIERRAEIARMLADLGPVTHETWRIDNETDRYAICLLLPDQFSFNWLTLAEKNNGTGTPGADDALAEFLNDAPFAVAELLVTSNRLQAELDLTDRLLESSQRVLEAIPECPAHGPCIPHALDWIEKAKAALAENERMHQALKYIAGIVAARSCPRSELEQYVANACQPFLVEVNNATHE